MADLYARLRARQPVEYGAFLHSQQGERILSFSPELFFRIDGQDGERRITTKPMKGTAARGRTTREDRVRAEWLRNDAKNRAENLMIVDLLRNDLGRLANVRHRAHGRDVCGRALFNALANDLDRERSIAIRCEIPRHLPRAVSMRICDRRTQNPRHATASRA